jgi:hypothetical protein
VYWMWVIRLWRYFLGVLFSMIYSKLIFLHRVWKHIIYINSTIVFCIYRYTIITLLSQCSILVSYWNSIRSVSLYSFIHHVWRHIVHISQQVVGLLFVPFISLSTSCMKTHCPHFSSSYYCLFPLLVYIPFYIMYENTLSTFVIKLLLFVSSSTIIFQKL